jgi:ABC-2 type transport system ATP-binding protein
MMMKKTLTSLDHPISVRGLSKRFVVKTTQDANPSTTGWFGSSRKHILRQNLFAVNDVSLTIGSSELFGLLGPNGAGKTTLIRMLCTLLWPTDGTAQVNGYDIRKMPRHVRASIGTVLDVDMGWYDRLSCRQNLAFYSQISGFSPSHVRRRVDEVLRTVGLGERGDERFQKLSSGMRRKLDVARALLPDPPVLLLDEPTVGMDPHSGRNLRQFIKNELCGEQGRTILLTTHNMFEAEQICDRVAIMHKGRIIAIDAPDRIKNLVKSDTTIIVVAGNATSRLVDSIAELEDVITVTSRPISTFPNALRIESHVKNASVAATISQIVTQSGGLLYSVRAEEPTLEDALVKLTGEP